MGVVKIDRQTKKLIKNYNKVLTEKQLSKILKKQDKHNKKNVTQLETPLELDLNLE